MALIHLKTDGTETGLTAADKINLSFTQTDTNVADIATNLSSIDANALAIADSVSETTDNTDAIILLDGRVTVNEGDIVTNGDNILINEGNITINTDNAVLLEDRVTVTEGNTTINTDNAVLLESRVTVNEGNITLNTDNISALALRVTDVEAPISIPFIPQTDEPNHEEGQIFYDENEHTIKIQTDIDGVDLNPLNRMVRVINLTGSNIPKDKAVRNIGVDSVSHLNKIDLAKADSLTTAFVIGFTKTEIVNGTEGWVQASGPDFNFDTTNLTEGATMFLSDTDAGEVVHTPPHIATALGSVNHVDTNGKVYIKIDNLIEYPTITGFLKGQTGGSNTYAVTDTPQPITNYDTEVARVITVDKALGSITLPINGIFSGLFTAHLEFSSSSQTRTLYFELYNDTASVSGIYPRTIPKDASEEGVSFSFPLEGTAGHDYKIRVSADTDLDLIVHNCAFMLSSIHLG